MSMKHLLFPAASAAEGKEGLGRAAQVAKALAAKLTILRVVDPFRDGGPKPVREEAESMGAGRFGLSGLEVRVQANSDLAAGIMRFATTEAVDAIVLPPRKRSWIEGRSGNDDLVRRLAGEGPCPIWLTKPDQEGSTQDPLHVGRILCPVSGRDHKVLEIAALLSDRLGAELFVLHVVPEIQEDLLAYGFDEHVALSADNGMELLAGMQRTCGTNGQPIVEIGNKTKSISKVSRALGADLVVTGRRESPITRFWQNILPVRPNMAYQTLMI